MGQDGHDRGQKVVATAFKDIGFDVVIGPLFQTPEESAKMGIENDVDVIAASSLAAGHLNLVPSLRDALKAQGRNAIMIIHNCARHFRAGIDVKLRLNMFFLIDAARL